MKTTNKLQMTNRNAGPIKIGLLRIARDATREIRGRYANVRLLELWSFTRARQQIVAATKKKPRQWVIFAAHKTVSKREELIERKVKEINSAARLLLNEW